MRERIGKGVALLGTLSMLSLVPARAQVFTSEFFSTPASEGWEMVLQSCGPETWIAQGWYYQQLDLKDCPNSHPSGRDIYRHSLQTYNGTEEFFVEYRLEADGNRSEIPGGSPAVLVLGNSFGLAYHITVARDLVKILRDVDLPISFIEVKPGVPHTIRVDLYPDSYAVHIDGFLIDNGISEGPFPAHDSRLTWGGAAWYLPCQNAWDYIRYGVIPEDGSGDFDSDRVLSLIDHYFVVDCLTKDGPGVVGGPGENAGPGCRFADFDADGDTDLLDFAEFQNVFAGSHL